MPASQVLDELRARGEYVPTHLSTVPGPFVRQLRELHPVAERAFEPREAAPQGLRVEPGRQPLPAPLPTRRRRPGPKPVLLGDFYFDDNGRLLGARRNGEASVRDIAHALGVHRSTVRKWVQRGHLAPVRFERGAMVFSMSDVVAACDQIHARTLDVPGLKANIPAKFHDYSVSIAEAAVWAHVQPATIRSWIHRGHLKPTNPGSRPTLLRVGDVFQVARGARRASKYPGR